MFIREIFAMIKRRVTVMRRLSQPEIVSGTVTNGPVVLSEGPAGDTFVVVCDAHDKEYLIRMTAEQAEGIEPCDAVVVKGYHSAHKGYIDAISVKNHALILGNTLYEIPRIF